MSEPIDSLEPYVLASASPRRRELLGSLGVRFTVVPTQVAEDLPAGASAEQAALAIARRKAAAAMQNLGRGTVIAGDTVVAVRDLILGKPNDRDDAVRILGLLSGTTHRVISAVALGHQPSGLMVAAYDLTHITMRELSEREIVSYVATGEADDKAGAYAIQETGDRFVTERAGAFDTVVGFPRQLFLELREQLRRQLSG
jgi:septum formation protein